MATPYRGGGYGLSGSGAIVAVSSGGYGLNDFTPAPGGGYSLIGSGPAPLSPGPIVANPTPSPQISFPPSWSPSSNQQASYQQAAPGPMITPAIQQQPQENSMWTNVWGTQYNMWGGLGNARRGALETLLGGGGF